jgi:hypothetical protein
MTTRADAVDSMIGVFPGGWVEAAWSCTWKKTGADAAVGGTCVRARHGTIGRTETGVGRDQLPCDSGFRKGAVAKGRSPPTVLET